MSDSRDEFSKTMDAMRAARGDGMKLLLHVAAAVVVALAIVAILHAKPVSFEGRMMAAAEGQRIALERIATALERMAARE